MAITRIKNNQITDATIVGSTKLVDYSVSGSKLANALTYGSDLTVSGNLTVNGTTTTIDSTTTSIEDAVIVLGINQTVGDSDIGLIGNRGSDSNIAFVWDESEDKFVFALTSSDGVSNPTNITISSYADIKANIGEFEELSGNLELTGGSANSVVFLDANSRLTSDGDLTFDGTTLGLVGDLTVDDVSIDGSAITGDGALSLTTTGDGNISIVPGGNGVVSIENLTIAGMTANSVVFTNADGSLSTGAGLTYNGTTFTAANVSVVGDSVSGSGNLTVAATGNLILDPTTSVIVDTATATRVFYAGAEKELIGSSNFVYNAGSASTSSITVGGAGYETSFGPAGITKGGIHALAISADSLNISGASGITLASSSGSVDIEGIVVEGATLSTTANASIVLSPNGTGNVSVDSSYITNVVDPVNDQDAATKAYVDSQIGSGGSQIQQGDSSVSVVDAGDGNITTTVDGIAVISSTNSATTFTTAVVVNGNLTVDTVSIDGDEITASGNLVIAPVGDLIITASGNNTEVFFAGTGGALASTDLFTFDESIGNGVLYVAGRSQAGDEFYIENIAESSSNVSLTYDRITASEGFTIDADAGNIVLTTDVGNNIIISDATATGVFYAGADKELLTNANLTFNGTALGLTGTANIVGALTVDNITIDGDSVSSTNDLNLLAVDGNIVITPDAVTGTVTITNLEIAGMDPYRVAFTGDDGQLKTDGNLQFDGDDLVVIGTATFDNIKFDTNTINTTIADQQLRIEANGTGDFYVDRNVVVSGNLSVLGTTTTVNSTVVTITDPIIELGRGENNTPLITSDGKDRGVRLWYFDVTEKSAWMGYDDPTDEFRYFSDATVTDEEVTGTLGTVNVGMVKVDTITIDDTSMVASGGLQLLSGLDTDLTIQAGGTGKVVVPSGDQFRVADLDTSRVVFTTTGGELISDANLTFDGANLVISGKATVDNVTIDGNSIAGAGGLNLASTADGNVSIVPNGNGVVNVDGLAVDGTTISSVATDSNIVLDPNGTGVVDVSTSRITNVVDPSGAQDAATKAYVDSQIGSGGSQIQQGDSSVAVVDAGTGTVTTTVDGVAVISSTNSATTFTTAVVVNGSLDVDNVLIDGQTISSDTGNLNLSGNVIVATAGDATEVFFAGAAGQITSDAAFTFGSGNVNVTGNVIATAGVQAGDYVWVENGISINSDNTITNTNGGIEINVSLDAGANIANIVLSTANGNVIVDTADVAPTGVFYAGAGKQLLSGTDFVYDSTNNIVTAGTFSASDALTVSLTPTGVDSTGQLDITTAANGNINITPNGTGIVSITNLAIAGLDANRIVVTDASGALVDSDAFTFSVASNALVLTGSAAIDNVTINGDSVSGAANLTVAATGNLVLDPTANVIVDTATANQVFYAGAAKELIGNANLTFDGSALTVIGSATVDNVVVDGADITSNTGVLTINAAAGDVDVRISGDTVANLFVVDAGTDSVVIGSAATTADVTFKVDATDSMMVPVGTTAERPTVGVVGMLRFNETIGEVEVFDGTIWDTIGTEFTLIASETFNGDDSTTTFTLADDATTASVIVSINGVVQLPTTAYAVSGTSLNFTQAPASGDVVEVRRLTTTTTFSVEVVNTAETARVVASESAAQIDVTGNLVPTANVTYDLGSASFRWNDLYLSGTTIDLGGVLIRNDAGEIKFFESDGTTPAAFGGVLGGDVSLDGGEY